MSSSKVTAVLMTFLMFFSSLFECLITPKTNFECQINQLQKYSLEKSNYMTLLSKFSIFHQKWPKIGAQNNVDLSNQNYKVNMNFTKIFIYVKSPQHIINYII